MELAPGGARDSMLVAQSLGRMSPQWSWPPEGPETRGDGMSALQWTQAAMELAPGGARDVGRLPNGVRWMVAPHWSWPPEGPETVMTPLWMSPWLLPPWRWRPEAPETHPQPTPPISRESCLDRMT